MDTGKKELGAFPKNLHKCNTKGKKIAMLLWSFFLMPSLLFINLSSFLEFMTRRKGFPFSHLRDFGIEAKSV